LATWSIRGRTFFVARESRRTERKMVRNARLIMHWEGLRGCGKRWEERKRLGGRGWKEKE